MQCRLLMRFYLVLFRYNEKWNVHVYEHDFTDYTKSSLDSWLREAAVHAVELQKLQSESCSFIEEAQLWEIGCKENTITGEGFTFLKIMPEAAVANIPLINHG